MLVPLMVREVSQNNFGLTNSAVWWCDVEIPEINDMIRCLFITIAKYVFSHLDFEKSHHQLLHKKKRNDKFVISVVLFGD